MGFDVLLYSAVTVCIIGICVRVHTWIAGRRGQDLAARSGPGFTDMAGAGLWDVLFQARLLRAGSLRWLGHFLIFSGFISLLFMHTMDGLITERLFASYYPTVNPFFFLRSLFGLMVLAGLGMAAYRRYMARPSRLKNAAPDHLALILVFGIIISGVLLEGMKMASDSEFGAMVEEYAGLDRDDEEIQALEAYWVKEFGLVSAGDAGPVDEETIQAGIESHEAYCMDCHDAHKSAFLGYAAAKFISPVALALDGMNGVTLFYYVHILSCFIGLALLPFTKMFHIVSTPVSLLVNSGPPRDSGVSGAASATQRMELDACTHCGTCSATCSAAMMYESAGNECILPSEKIGVLKNLLDGKAAGASDRAALFQGLYLCTNCDRCTTACPSGIRLNRLWHTAREILLQQQVDDPYVLSVFSFIRGLNNAKTEQADYALPADRALASVTDRPDPGTPLDIGKTPEDRLSGLPGTETFAHCFGCRTCTTVCPVVGAYDRPEEALVLLPHQIMYSLGAGLPETARKTAMPWNCLSCYQCQEHCPQGVGVCDILFALKNRAFNPDRTETAS